MCVSQENIQKNINTATKIAKEMYRVEHPFLPINDNITKEWFRSFLNRWGVNRTIDKSKYRRDALIREINKKIPEWQKMPPEKLVQEVDDFAEYCFQRKLANCRPISFVSKILFFIRPDVSVPMDSYNKKSLNFPRYRIQYHRFYKAFEECYNLHRAAILHHIRTQKIIEELQNHKINVDEEIFARKVFDNILMMCGGRDMRV